MDVPFLDLKTQYPAIRDEVRAAVDAVLESQEFVLGPIVEDLERRIAERCGCAHAVGVSSGSDALIAALLAVGLGPGDEAITTAFSFFATAGSIARVGATPVFVDINHASFSLDAARIDAAVTPRTKAIVPVHLFGQCADMDAILDVARRRGLKVVEDAAQAIDARHRDRPAGSMGDCGCLSFYPTKNLGGAGDGGMVLTNDAVVAERVRALRAHGLEPDGRRVRVGGNFRLDAIQAAVLRAKLPHLDAWTEARRRIARRYDERLRGIPGLTTPTVAAGRVHVFHQYVVRIAGGRRDAVAERLRSDGVGTAVFYPRPLPFEECFGSLGHREGSFPEAEAASCEVLALPIYPGLTDGHIEHVTRSVRGALG